MPSRREKVARVTPRAPLPDVRWPASFAWIALLGAFVLAVAAGSAASEIARGFDGGQDSQSLAATAALDATFVAVAFVLAAAAGRGHILGDLGLRALPLRRLVGWVAAGAGAFYAFSLFWTAVIGVRPEQDIVESLGADRPGTARIVAAVLVVGVAPFAEELFFRGFVYRALRVRLPVAASTLIVAVIFGAIHFTGPASLGVVVPLALLGAVFCLLYEVTGSLWPSIVLHALNNTVAFAATVNAPLAGAVGATAMVAWIFASRRPPAST